MSQQPTLHAPRRSLRPDLLAILALAVLWLLYFWRIFTPEANDALSLTEGDFSGQFVAFMGYQTERLSEGEIPLWNPYTYAGHPFLADTQSAVFYPPRLLTVTLVSVFTDASPGDLYAALETEMAIHVLLGTLLMYAFVRRLTAGDSQEHPGASIVASLVAALTWGYAGYLSGYPQLQLAVMEAGIWLPLILLGVLQATQTPRPGWLCLVLAGVAWGLSLLAGHPQTSLFSLYLAVAFLAYRLWLLRPPSHRAFGQRLVLAAALLVAVGGGLAAIQLLPGLEYLQHTTRQDLGFDAKGNGFPVADLAQVLFPGFITHWSPLYVGVTGIILAAIAIWRRSEHSAFFGLTALVALIWSFGAHTVLYDLVYLLAPGTSWFRGQERAAFIVAHSASILAGLGTMELLREPIPSLVARRVMTFVLGALVALCVLVALVLFLLWLGPNPGEYEPALQSAAFAALLAGLAAAVLNKLIRTPAQWLARLALVTLVVFDLFSITLGDPNYDPGRARDRLPEPAMVARLRDELLPLGARVDGARGVRENYGTLYGVADIRGISPLELAVIHTLREDVPVNRTWDLLAVRYVLTDWEELSVPSTIVATAEDAFGAYNVHELAAPRDFAHLTYGVTRVATDAEAYGLLREPAYDVRRWAILASDPGIALPEDAPDEPGTVDIRTFEPERIALHAQTPAPAILTLALPHYPGWRAMVNGKSVDILRAYGGLSALALPPVDDGQYEIELEYRPWTFTAGAVLSTITLGLVLVATATAVMRRTRIHADRGRSGGGTGQARRPT